MTRILILCLALTSCASVQHAQMCRAQAGPEPYAAADLFGPAGLLIANQDPGRHAWQRQVDECMREPG